MNEYICPHCKNPIHDEEALSCHFCGESLNRAGKGFISNLRYGSNRLGWYILAVILALAVVMLFIR
ncbi:MAG: hypothetical protein KBD53_00810 [Candidatus Omnitrophica bacterium]|nr:hypothetical protein [Candidatus Omnitrophota bacterium]